MKELLLIVVLIILCFTAIMVYSIYKGQSIRSFKVKVPKILEIETEMQKKEDRCSLYLSSEKTNT